MLFIVSDATISIENLSCPDYFLLVHGLKPITDKRAINFPQQDTLSGINLSVKLFIDGILPSHSSNFPYKTWHLLSGKSPSSWNLTWVCHVNVMAEGCVQLGSPGWWRPNGSVLTLATFGELSQLRMCFFQGNVFLLSSTASFFWLWPGISSPSNLLFIRGLSS